MLLTAFLERQLDGYTGTLAFVAVNFNGAVVGVN